MSKLTTQKWSHPCELLLRARLVPDRGGADTQVIAHIPLSQLRAMPGAAGLEDAWIRAVLGQDGYLTGKDAEAAACDAATVPLVTGTMDMSVIDQMIDLALAAFGHGAPDPAGPGPSGASTGRGNHDGHPDRGAQAEPAGWPARTALSPGARQALRHAIARLTIDLVSGPNGIAATLRTGLLPPPWNTPSLPLDTGRSRTIPAHIRRAVQARDQHCAWPRCQRPAAWCDVHHITHQADGGKTAVTSCVLLCQYHHDTCIHRNGWQIILYPDGTTTARGPRGQTRHSNSPPGHAPPTARAG